MSEQQPRRRGEKEEKQEEKEEKERREKSVEEKWRRDPLSIAFWAALLVWSGLVLLADNLNFLARFRPVEAWDLIFIGAGLLLLAIVVIRLTIPEYRRPVVGNLILGIILLAIGLGDLVGWGAFWAVALILIGVAILLGGLLRGR